MTKRERRRRSDDGLPIDAKEWTEADWSSLHRAMEQAKQEIRGRHAGPLRTAEGSQGAPVLGVELPHHPCG